MRNVYRGISIALFAFSFRGAVHYLSTDTSRREIIIDVFWLCWCLFWVIYNIIQLSKSNAS
jgi:hypothetical protein